MGTACTFTFTSCYGMPPNYDPYWEFPDAYGMPPNYKRARGFVYEDLNGNGSYDEGEGISEIGVYFSDDEIDVSNDDGS
ncbi:MAG: hypothetical protein J6Y93_01435, partial [Treponema sp.]|nr:hypothetical protein [Treponema sp.]